MPGIDAQRYAEFYGKRLAGHYEMEYALRGPELWTKPWGHGQKPKGFPANVGSLPLPTTEPIRVSYQRELRHLMHVREPGYQHAPFGLFHAYGNATQRTWGIAMFPSQALEPSMLIKRVGDRLVFGESYGGWTSKFDYSDHRTAGQSRGTNSWGIGFRCVLSAQVPNTGNQ
ncbi:MAG: SUMF1/EgtB/PvdO family nonheme iron enzyme [Planctomycetota bacterium]|nr:SUMF1/EgtB/PvdO family nonheme iron enzyme [Planctomycetota bacterium]